MVDVDVKLDETALHFLEEEYKRYPAQVRRAWYYANGICLKNMRARMSGHHKDIPRWHPFTRKFRKASIFPSHHVFGGRLMYPTNRVLTMQPEGDRCRLGWIGGFEEAATKFQEGGAEETTTFFRHFVYSLEIVPKIEVPLVATTPPRPVVEPVLQQARFHMDEWIIGAFAKTMEGKIKAWEFRYHSTKHTKMGAAAARRVADASGSLGAAQEYLARLNHGDFGA